LDGTGFTRNSSTRKQVLRNEEVEGPVEKKKESLLNDKFSSTSGLIL
jgi:hypothetical protein